MLLEEFEGTVIFATNLMENYDTAFNSRILKHIKFELPNHRLRVDMIKKMIPQKTPKKEGEFSEGDIAELAEMSEGFSGREIKNAILNGIITSARTREYFSFEDAKKSFNDAKVTCAVTRESSSTKTCTDNVKEKIQRKLRRAFKKQSLRKSQKMLYRGLQESKKTYREVKVL